MTSLLKSKAFRFGTVGAASTLIDLFIYSASLTFLPGSYLVSKAFGFIGGTIFGFYLNRQWTFSHQGKVGQTLIKYFVLYASTLVLNLTSNQAILGVLGTSLFAKGTAFLIATAITAITNFLVMRKFIFKGQA